MLMPNEDDKVPFQEAMLAAFGNPMGAKIGQQGVQQTSEGANTVKQEVPSLEDLLLGSAASAVVQQSDPSALNWGEKKKQSAKPSGLDLEDKVVMLDKEVARIETLLAANIRVHGALLSQLQAAMATVQQLDQDAMDSVDETLKYLVLHTNDNLEPLVPDHPDHSLGGIGMALADPSLDDLGAKPELQPALNGEEKVVALEKKIEALTVTLDSKIRENKGLFRKLGLENEQIAISKTFHAKPKAIASKNTAVKPTRGRMGM